MLIFCTSFFITKAQVFHASSSPETQFPLPASASMYYLDNQISYLYNSSLYTPKFYAPPFTLSGTSTVSSWSHKMYVNSAGFSATDGGGFALGVIDLMGNYAGLVTTAMPNASNICAVALNGLC